MWYSITQFAVVVLSVTTFWWFWPIRGIARALKSGMRVNTATSVLLQISLTSAAWGFMLGGTVGAIVGILFPPIWLLSLHLLLENAVNAHLPLWDFSTPFLIAGAASLTLFALGTKIRAFTHCALVAPTIAATLIGITAMDRTVQDRIEMRAIERHATCLSASSLWQSLNRWAGGQPLPHAIAVLDGRYVSWSYTLNDFYPVDFGIAPTQTELGQSQEASQPLKPCE